MWPLTLIVIVGSAFATSRSFGQVEAHAPVYVSKPVGLVHFVELQIDDQVDGNCWTNADAVVQGARLTFEQSGIGVFMEPLVAHPLHAPLVTITGLGGRTKAGVCFGDIAVEVQSNVMATYGQYGEFKIFMDALTYSNRSVAIASDNLNESFSETVASSVNEFAANVLADRRDATVSRLLDTVPYVDEPPSTWKEWKADTP
ncbi:MAG: hypothetical protein H0V34_14000 [Gammaproteobacteria bacterium]|nr:hypothetical protein [Gammaproteobacteria bacterium]